MEIFYSIFSYDLRASLNFICTKKDIYGIIPLRDSQPASWYNFSVKVHFIALVITRQDRQIQVFYKEEEF